MQELILNYTERCNGKCTTCNLWKIKKPKTLSLDIIEKLLQADRLKGLEKCYLSGGEPFMTNDCVKIAELLKKYHPSITLLGATNSVSPILERILKMKIKVSLSVSLNGTPDTNDKTRGEGHFEKAIQLMNELKQNNIPFDIAYLEINASEIDFINELAKDFGVNVGVTKLRKGERYGTEEGLTDLCPNFNCPALTDIIVVNPDGSVTACEKKMDELYLGNLYKTDLDKMNWDKVKNFIKEKKCQPCSMLCFYNKRLWYLL